MALTPEDVRNKQFATVRFKEGYDLDEVDKFLDDVEAEIIRLTTENEDLREKLSKAESGPAVAAPPPPPVPSAPVAPQVPAAPPVPVAPPAPVVPPAEAAVAMLALAQKTADEYVANAKAEADRTVSAARIQAERALSEKELQRSALEKKIEELRAFEREYRTRLRTYIEGQLHELDTRTGDNARPSTPVAAAPLAPAAPPMTPRPMTVPPTPAETTRPLPPTPPPVPPVPPVPPAPFGGNIPTAPPREG